MLSTVAAAVVAFGMGRPAPSSCKPADCLKRVVAKAAAISTALQESALPGQWTNGAGLAGSELYLFHDGTYIYTEWADIQPETVYDKGHWVLAEGVLTLSADTDITWDSRSDGRYLTIREGRSDDDLLLGLARTLEVFEELAKAEPESAQGYLRASGLRRSSTWTRDDSSRVKADIMKRCWRPAYFAK